MIRLLILGQPYWSNRFAALAARIPGGAEARFLAPREVFTREGRAWVRQADVFLRMGYRPGAPTWRGRAFDALWALLRRLNPRARAAHYWIGTDVLNTLEDFRAGTLRKGPLARSRADLHWADAPWLVDELREVGLESRYIALPVPLEDVSVPERLPEPFTVLTYIPDGRAEFYDGPSLLQAARALPDVRFEVIGGTGTWVEQPPPNLSFHGWQVDVRPFLERATVVVRLVRHDGMGGTVREALQAGRIVLYSHPMPCVTRVPFQDPAALTAELASLRDRFRRGELAPNAEGHAYVLATFDLATCLDAYRRDLDHLLGRTQAAAGTRP
ncbi:glycosyltransferase family protein [Mesoterricola sediminis]|uniref:Glycosyltransferase family 1 protein n=1 Tax=Mesoterricola sediminis TaxID=2927980 RepID=A0AA48KBK1_9BACT|nr:hypothetical protein [Mesoterricola sediminis]BDU75921.1 hypothetical protein METESE_08790 [Mesoterricola sediminis]